MMAAPAGRVERQGWYGQFKKFFLQLLLYVENNEGHYWYFLHICKIVKQINTPPVIEPAICSQVPVLFAVNPVEKKQICNWHLRCSRSQAQGVSIHPYTTHRSAKKWSRLRYPSIIMLYLDIQIFQRIHYSELKDWVCGGSGGEGGVVQDHPVRWNEICDLNSQN